MGIEPRPFEAELEGYAYLPRMFDKARLSLSGVEASLFFGCPLDHTCMSLLGVAPADVLAAVAEHGDDDSAVLGALRDKGIPSAGECWFDAQGVEDELMTDVYLRVRGHDRIRGIDARPGDRVVLVAEGAARIFLGDKQQRVVRAGEVVRIPPELPHRIEPAAEPIRLVELSS